MRRWSIQPRASLGNGFASGQFLINYSVGKARYEKEPDSTDHSILNRTANLHMPSEVPTNAFPIDEMYHGSRIAPKGFTHVHHMFLPRASHALAAMWRRAVECEDHRLRNMLLFFVEQAIWGMSVLNRYSPSHFSQVNRQLSGVYYIGSQIAEVSPWYILDGKLNRLTRAFNLRPARANTATIATGDCSASRLPDNSIDYVFTDPPFGENIYYADLNYLVESWYRILTSSGLEAIVDRAKGKGILDYQHLMQRCFAEYHRVLRPGRWMTLVFHNSKNAVWNAIQEAMLAAGFVVADVRTLDKRQGSYRQVTSTAVKQDLVISAYKPNDRLENRFRLVAGDRRRCLGLRPHPSASAPRIRRKGRASRDYCRASELFTAFRPHGGLPRPAQGEPFPLSATPSFTPVWNSDFLHVMGCISSPIKRRSMTRSA